MGSSVVPAGGEAAALVERDLLLAEHPALRQAVVDLLDEEQADFLEKA